MIIKSMEKMKVFIDGKETNLNALDFLQFALDVKTGKKFVMIWKKGYPENTPAE